MGCVLLSSCVCVCFSSCGHVCVCVDVSFIFGQDSEKGGFKSRADDDINIDVASGVGEGNVKGSDDVSIYGTDCGSEKFVKLEVGNSDGCFEIDSGDGIGVGEMTIGESDGEAVRIREVKLDVDDTGVRS